jgi:hypothetical protein
VIGVGSPEINLNRDHTAFALHIQAGEYNRYGFDALFKILWGAPYGRDSAIQRRGTFSKLRLEARLPDSVLFARSEDFRTFPSECSFQAVVLAQLREVSVESLGDV